MHRNDIAQVGAAERLARGDERLIGRRRRLLLLHGQQHLELIAIRTILDELRLRRQRRRIGKTNETVDGRMDAEAARALHVVGRTAEAGAAPEVGGLAHAPRTGIRFERGRKIELPGRTVERGGRGRCGSRSGHR